MDKVLQYTANKKNISLSGSNRNVLNQIAENDSIDRAMRKKAEKVINKAQVSRNPITGFLASVGSGANYGTRNALTNFLAVRDTVGTNQAMDELKSYGAMNDFVGIDGASGITNKQIEDVTNFHNKNKEYIESERHKKSAELMDKMQAVDDKYQLGKVGEFAQEVGTGIGEMAGSLALGAINPTVGLASFGVQAGSNAYGQARDEGANESDALKYGVASGLLETGVERLGGGLGKFYGKGLDDVLLHKLGKDLSNKTLKGVAFNTARGALGEGIEEGISEVANPFLQRATYNPNAENATLGEVGKSMALGATIGGLLGGGTNVLDHRLNRNKPTVSNAETVAEPQNQAVMSENVVEDINTPTEETKQFKEDIQKVTIQDNRIVEPNVEGNSAIQNPEQLQQRVNEFIRDVDVALTKIDLKKQYDDTIKGNMLIKGDTVYINPNFINNPNDTMYHLKQVLAHEIFHSFEGTKESDTIIRLANQTSQAEQMKAYLKDLYARNGVVLDDVGLNAELGAKMVEQAMTDEQTINRILLEDVTLAQKILQKIKDLISLYQKKRNLSKAEYEDYKLLLKARRQYEMGIAKLRSGEYVAGNIKGRYEDRHSFVGVHNRNIYPYGFKAARQLNGQGADMEFIRQKTGWFKNELTGNRWVNEIDDSTAKLLVGPQDKGFYNVDEVIEHPNLFKAYPELRNVKVIVRDFDKDEEFYGLYIPSEIEGNIGAIHINSKYRDKKEMKNTILHELQHVIQEIEGLPFGTTNYEWNDRIAKYVNPIVNLNSKIGVYKKRIGINKLESERYKYKNRLEFEKAVREMVKKSPYHQQYNDAMRKYGKKRKEYLDFMLSYIPSYRDKKERYEKAINSLPLRLSYLAKQIDYYDNLFDSYNKALYMNMFIDEKKNFKDFAKEIEEYSETKGQYDSVGRQLFLFNSPQKMYENTLGEIMSFETGKRQDMTKEERKANKPFAEREDWKNTYTIENVDNFIDKEPSGYRKDKYNEFYKMAEESNGRYSFSDKNALFGGSGGGYDGHSMSNRARSAYENGEKPISKWNKKTILEEAGAYVVDDDVLEALGKLRTEELKNLLIEKTSWHHTGSFYNTTDFYGINEDKLYSLTLDDIQNIIDNRPKRATKTEEEKEQARKEKEQKLSIEEKADEIYKKMNFIHRHGKKMPKKVGTLYNKFFDGKMDIDKEYQKTIDYMIESGFLEEQMEKDKKRLETYKSQKAYKSKKLETEKDPKEIEMLELGIKYAERDIKTQEHFLDLYKTDKRKYAELFESDNVNHRDKDYQYLKNFLTNSEESNGRYSISEDNFANEKGYDRNLYHQTGSTFNEFNFEHQVAGKYDSATPTGIFMKDNAEDIGVGGNIQMNLRTRIKNPLHFKNREEMLEYWNENVQGYKELQNKIAEINSNNNSITEKLKQISMELWEKKQDKTITQKEASEIMQKEKETALDEITKWKEKVNELSLRAKKLLDKYINSSKYDGVIIDEDEGSLGRKVKTYIALQPNQVKLAHSEIPLSQRFDDTKNDIRYSISEDNVKIKQLDIIKRSNPAPDDYHTWIREIDDIRTYKEALDDEGYDGYDISSDYTEDMVKNALKKGTITIYSSYPIKNGVFVSPSKIEAGSYAGNRKVYSKKVPLKDVAWIDSIQGQYAPTEDKDIRYSINELGSEERDRYQEAIDKYGTLEKGMQPRVDIDVPKKKMDDENVRRYTRTALESPNVDNQTKDRIIDDLTADISSGRFTYEPTTNQKQQKSANDRIARDGEDASYQTFKTNFKDNKRMKAEDIALAEQLVINFSHQGEVDKTVDLLGMLSVLGTEQGQSIQALSLLKRMTPEGRLQRLITLTNRLNSRYGLEGEDAIKIPSNDASLLLNQKTPDGMDEAEAKIINDVAKQMPPTLMNKLDAWRYLSMLGNLRTHMRNILGNAMHYGLRLYKDEMAGMIERLALKEGERTKAIGITSRENLDFAREDFKKNGKKLLSNASKYDDKAQVERAMNIFGRDSGKTKAFWNTLEKLRKFNMDTMEAEDMFFKKKTYERALARYMQANNFSVETLENNPKMLEKAQQYAVNEARIATFQEANSLAEAISHFENKKSSNKGVKVAQVGVKAVMPFKKTPLNIAKRGFEYSPAGLVKALAFDLRKVKKGEMTATQAIDNITMGLSGSSIMLLGMFMMAHDLLTTGWDNEDKRKQSYKNQLGEETYALRLPDGSTYTIDWAAPFVMPLFVGAEAYKQYRDDNGEDKSLLNNIMKFSMKVIDPIMETSMMEGLQRALTSFSTGTTESIVGMGENMLTGYLSQYVPTLFGQMARIIDDTKRTTYAPKNSPYTPEAEKFGRQMMNKVPLASFYSEPSIDIWGRERKQEGGNVASRTALQMISPGQFSSNKQTAVDKEILRLQEALGESDVIPKMPEKTVQYDKKNYYLTAKEYTDFAKGVGQKNYIALNNLVGSKVYKDMSDEQKRKAVKEVYDYNNYLQKQSFFNKKNVSYFDKDMETMKGNLSDAGGWNNYLAIKSAFPGKAYKFAKEDKELCDKYNMNYEKFTQGKKMIDDISTGDTEQNRKERAIALAGIQGLTDEQRQIIWQEIYDGKKSLTYYQIKRKYRIQ